MKKECVECGCVTCVQRSQADRQVKREARQEQLYISISGKSCLTCWQFQPWDLAIESVSPSWCLLCLAFLCFAPPALLLLSDYMCRRFCIENMENTLVAVLHTQARIGNTHVQELRELLAKAFSSVCVYIYTLIGSQPVIYRTAHVPLY